MNKRGLLLIVTAIPVLIILVVLGRTLLAGGSSDSLPPAAGKKYKFTDSELVLNQFAESLRFRTITFEGKPLPAAEFKKFHAFLRRTYPRVHGKLKRREFSRHSLVFEWKGSDPALKPILLMAHQDVVSISERGEWRHPPFAGVRKDGYIWGRGALDHRPGIMGVLAAVESLLAGGFQPRRSVFLAFGHDEEIGGLKGAKVIARHFRERGLRFEFIQDEGMVIADGIIPGVKKSVALIGIAQKGEGSFELNVRGKGGHSSMPPPSTTPGILARAITRLEDNPTSPRLDGPAAAMFESLSPHMVFGSRLVFANRWLLDPILLRRLTATPRLNAMVRTTLATTVLRGGAKDNVIPTRARAIVNFRILPGDSIKGLLAYVRETIDDPRIKVSVQPGAAEPSGISSRKSEPYAMFSRSIRAVFPRVVVAPALFIAVSDTRYYQDLSPNIFRFQPVRLGPGDAARIHGSNERISEKNYLNYIRFFRVLIQNGAGG